MNVEIDDLRSVFLFEGSLFVMHNKCTLVEAFIECCDRQELFDFIRENFFPDEDLP